jgi:hypothetical protein
LFGVVEYIKQLKSSRDYLASENAKLAQEWVFFYILLIFKFNWCAQQTSRFKRETQNTEIQLWGPLDLPERGSFQCWTHWK